MFVMTMVAVSAFTYVGTNEHYLSSVFNIHDDFVSESNDVFDLLSEHPEIGDFKIMKIGGNFITAGQNNLKVAEILIDSNQSTIALKNLVFKIDGPKAGFVKNMNLVNKNMKIDGVKVGESFEFKQMDYLVNPSSNAVFEVYIDVEENLSPGTRAKIIIDKPSDLFVLSGGRPYSIYAYYPVNMKDLTIGGIRR